MTPGTILLAIVVYVVYRIAKGQEEKAENIAKYGVNYDPRYRKLRDFPKDQQNMIQAVWDNEAIDKEETNLQLHRKREEYWYKETKKAGFNMGIHDAVIATGLDSYKMSSLESYQTYANTLPAYLGDELMSIARRESRATAARNLYLPSTTLKEQTKEYNEARAHLNEVVAVCKAYTESNG